MLVELNRKGGHLCDQAKQGAIHCPVMIRPTSEDVITGEVFQALQIINPRYWLPQLLNRGLKTKHYRQQIFRNLRIDLWRNLPMYPRHLLPWSEGSTQIDVTIRWENPPTTILIEAKYLSKLATQTTNNDGGGEFPGDQLIRNIRVGLWETGWIQEPGLFLQPKRNFAVLLWAPKNGELLVKKYQQSEELQRSIPYGEKLLSLPPQPVGEVSYKDLIEILQGNLRWMLRPEKLLSENVIRYLEFKLAAGSQARVSRPTESHTLFQESHHD